MSQPGSVHRSLHEGVLTLTMDRPPVHALDDVLVADLQREFEAVDGDPDVGAVVLTATGTRAFCAGKDLRSFAGPDAPVLDRVEPGRRGREMLEAIRALSGAGGGRDQRAAVGGGMSIVAMCDCAVAARDAWIQTPEISVGLLGAFNHLASLVGPRRARYLYLSGRRCSAEELLEMGALVAVAEPEELLRGSHRDRRRARREEPRRGAVGEAGDGAHRRPAAARGLPVGAGLHVPTAHRLGATRWRIDFGT